MVPVQPAADITAPEKPNAAPVKDDNREKGTTLTMMSSSPRFDDMVCGTVCLTSPSFDPAADEASEKSIKPDTAEVPAGWEKHEDEDGAYYWHIATGTIQREMPTVEATNKLTAQHKRLAMPATVTFRNKVGTGGHRPPRSLTLNRSRP